MHPGLKRRRGQTQMRALISAEDAVTAAERDHTHAGTGSDLALIAGEQQQ